MSSFTIDKREYIKAAGLVSGLAESLQLWVFNYENYRNSTEEDYYNQFEKFFTMNALSVKEQYHGDEVGAPSSDSNSYKRDFDAMKKIGKSVGATHEGLKEIVAELQSFFDSAIYQTEKDAYMYQMQFYFNHLMTELYKKAFLHGNRDTKSWGSLEIDHIKTSKATRIM